MKKLLTIMLALVMGVSIVTVFAGCNTTPHEHTFSSEWSQDLDNHWKDATCEHSTEKSALGAHEWGADDVCTVCQAIKGHVHTFATDWSNDKTHHWKEATCEHTSEIKDKAEHTWGADDKCTVCQKAKPANEPTTSADVWTEQMTMNDLDNVTISAAMVVGTNKQASVFQIDGNKMRQVVHRDDVFSQETILCKIDDNTTEFYGKIREDSLFIKETPPTSVVSTFALNVRVFTAMGSQIKDNFADATFDTENKVYTLNFATANFESVGAVTNLTYKVKFLDDQVESVEIAFTASGSATWEISLVFGKTVITLPSADQVHLHTFATEWSGDDIYHWKASTCQCDNPDAKDQYGEHVWGADDKCTTCQKAKPDMRVVSSETWRSAIISSIQYVNLRATTDVTVGSTKIHNVVELDRTKMHDYYYTNNQLISEQVMAFEDGDYVLYEKNGDVFVLGEADEYDIEMFSSNFAFTYEIISMLVKEYEMAEYDGDNGCYVVEVADFESEYAGNVSNVAYKVYFNGGKLQKIEAQYTVGGMVNNVTFEQFNQITVQIPNV